MSKIGVGFLGAGGIARAHAYALQAMKYYYDDAPLIRLESVASVRPESRERFAEKFGFKSAESSEDFANNNGVEAVFILGPNDCHFEHLKLALKMKNVRYIYLEKPVCATYEEEIAITEMMKDIDPDINIQVGFQYLQTSAVREALQFWRSGILGKPIHFDIKYYHGDYLRNEYREKRTSRLTPAPGGGAMADLGSHGISLMLAFMGDDLQVTGALQAGTFPDVPSGSDLFSSISLVDPLTGAVGTMSASRVTSGSGDLVSLEFHAEKGSLRYSSKNSDCFEYYLEDEKRWIKEIVASSYSPVTHFPSGHVPPGWLRSMVHAHYLFFMKSDPLSFIPDLEHGVAVQRYVRETATHMKEFRKKFKNE